MCLICDQEFDSFINRICRDCHKKHETLFKSYGFSGNWQECVYDISPEEGDELNDGSRSDEKEESKGVLQEGSEEA